MVKNRGLRSRLEKISRQIIISILDNFKISNFFHLEKFKITFRNEISTGHYFLTSFWSGFADRLGLVTYLVTIFFAKTNGENTMIKILWWTVWFVVNSRFVKLERWIWCVDCNGNWTNMFQSMSQTFFVTFWTHGKTLSGFNGPVKIIRTMVTVIKHRSTNRTLNPNSFIISSTMGLGVSAWFKVDGFIWIWIFIIDTILVLKSSFQPLWHENEWILDPISKTVFYGRILPGHIGKQPP